MRLLVIVVIHDTTKRRSLIEDMAFVYIRHELFRFLLLCMRHDEYFEILRIWKNAALLYLNYNIKIQLILKSSLTPYVRDKRAFFIIHLFLNFIYA